MTDITLTFDPELHAYAYAGAPVPSVTAILRDAALVDFSFCTEFAKWRGSAVHKALHVELATGLDWSSVPESFHPFICAAKQYIEDHHAKIVEVERRVLSKLYRYAGTLDIIIEEHSPDICPCGIVYGKPRPPEYPPPGKLILVDWKTGPPRPATALQLAGYALAYFEETKRLIHERRAVHLTPTGDYHTTSYTNRTDRERFLAALTVANLRREYGLLETAA